MNEENLNTNTVPNTPMMESPVNETPFVEEPSTPVMETPVVEEPTIVPEPTPIVDTPVQSTIEPAPVSNNNQKKGNSLLIVVIILLVLLLGSIGYIFYDKVIVGPSCNKCNVTTDTTNTTDKEETTTESDTKVVGDETYGYLEVPKNWSNFSEVGGSHSLQWTYASVFIVSLDYIAQPQGTAEQYASSFLAEKKGSTDISGLTGATVKIGKNKEYTAYQVYMYYPSDNSYLITYWFETGDGVVRYISLEGPEKLSDTKITDLTTIPESFSLKK